jgi:hypothetical protein
MTAVDLIYPVLGPVIGFLGFLAVGLLGLAMLHMIGKTN